MSSAITKACIVGLASLAPALVSADPYVVTDRAPVVVVPAQPPTRQIVVQPGTVITTPGQTYVVQPGTAFPANDQQVIIVAPDAPPVSPGVIYYRTAPVGRDYRDERARCESLPFFERDRCTNQINRMTSGVDAKCEKLSGFELDNCLLGADHGQ